MSSSGAGMLFTGLMLLLGIASSKVSARIGIPSLVLFVGLGMLAGSEGIGGIPFEDYALANTIASVALALILFDGGLRTSAASLRTAWAPALTLSTVGVFVTAGVTGIAASWALGVPLLYGLLLGAITGSTDAAAVFAVLRSSGLKLPDRLGATLEVESGSNDPMAFFLTVGLIGLVTGQSGAGGLGTLFVLQFGVGGVVGATVGWGASQVTQRINLDAAGLYPLAALAFALVAFGGASFLGGSGFLAVYVAGIVLGTRPLVFRRGTLLFNDTAAWSGQIVLFAMLGLLSFPSRLIAVAPQGLVIAAVLVFVARPLAVVVATLPFGFRPKEIAYLSWGGLKGAVPITLATFPFLAGVEGAELIFDVTFFAVLLSALVQGWSLPMVAARLGIGRPADPMPPVRVEMHALRDLDGDVVDYTVQPGARVVGRALRDLVFPEGVGVLIVVRDHQVIIPRGATVVREGDHIFVARRTRLGPLVDALFDPYAAPCDVQAGFGVEIDARSPIDGVHRLFALDTVGTDLGGWSPDTPVRTLLAEDGGAEPVHVGPLELSPGSEEDLVVVVFDPTPRGPDPLTTAPCDPRVGVGGGTGPVPEAAQRPSPETPSSDAPSPTDAPPTRPTNADNASQ